MFWLHSVDAGGKYNCTCQKLEDLIQKKRWIEKHGKNMSISQRVASYNSAFEFYIAKRDSIPIAGVQLCGVVFAWGTEHTTLSQ